MKVAKARRKTQIVQGAKPEGRSPRQPNEAIRESAAAEHNIPTSFTLASFITLLRVS